MNTVLITKLLGLLTTQGSLAMGAALSLFSAILWLVHPDAGMMVVSWGFAAGAFALGLFAVQKQYIQVKEELLGTSD